MATLANSANITGNQVAWDSLMEMYLVAQSAADKFEKEEFEPLYELHTNIWQNLPEKCPEALNASLRWAEKVGYDKATDRFEDLIVVARDRERSLMAYPSPSMKALLWKLDNLFNMAMDDGEMPAWDMSYMRQTIEDYRHILGEAA